jgi:Uma2 family endonuclease
MATIAPDLTREATAGMTIQQLIHSPRLPIYVQTFQALLQEEQKKRERFYEEMFEDQKVEFINGEVVVQSPVKLRHTIASQNLFTLLSLYVTKHNLGYVGHEKILVTLTRNDYDPDIVYFGPEKAQTFTPDLMKFPAPDFVTEVLSPSTEDVDRGVKFQDYAAHGVVEYWIIDPDAKLVEQYILEGEAYRLHVKANTGTIYSVALQGFAVPVRAVFDEAARFAAVQAILDAKT